jgi:hypothetical protein
MDYTLHEVLELRQPPVLPVDPPLRLGRRALIAQDQLVFEPAQLLLQPLQPLTTAQI